MDNVHSTKTVSITFLLIFIDWLVFIEEEGTEIERYNALAFQLLFWGEFQVLFFLKNFSYSITVVHLNISLLFYYTFPIFHTFLYSIVPRPNSTVNPHLIPCPWVSHTWSFTSYFPFFSPLMPSPSPLVALSLFLLPMPLALFSSFVCFLP